MDVSCIDALPSKRRREVGRVGAAGMKTCSLDADRSGRRSGVRTRWFDVDGSGHCSGVRTRS